MSGETELIEIEHPLTVVNTGPVRLIGQLPKDRPTNGGFYLSQVGVLIVQRGVQQGRIAGSMENVKALSIASLDFCRGPQPSIYVHNYEFMTQKDDMPPEDFEVMQSVYAAFLNGELPQIITALPAPRTP